MDRDSQQYQEHKLAYNLICSPEWVALLKPYLLRKQAPVRKIQSQDDAFMLANQMAEFLYARNLIAAIETMAEEFVGFQEAPEESVET